MNQYRDTIPRIVSNSRGCLSSTHSRSFSPILWDDERGFAGQETGYKAMTYHASVARGLDERTRPIVPGRVACSCA